MDKIKPILNNWLSELDQYELPDYEKFPDIELYMDQVITYLKRELKVLQTSSLDNVITSSMVNNYVKGKVVSAPISKKYNKEHLALIYETCTLKSVLTISEIKQILDSLYSNTPKCEAFNEFKKSCRDEFKKAIEFTSLELDNIKDDNDLEALTKLALTLSITANAYITIAKRILYYNKKYSDMKEINAELNSNKNN